MKNKKILISILLVLLVLISVELYFYLMSPNYSGKDISTELKNIKWGNNVSVKYSDGYVEVSSNGVPNHSRESQYIVPKGGGMAVSEGTVVDDPTSSRDLHYKFTTKPTLATSKTSAPLGSIGIMISGASLFNPYEGDGSTVAMMSNFSVKNSNGVDVYFLDKCNAHPTPAGDFHYHGFPNCVASQVDTEGGPSHIIGLAYDGFPIYGNKDIDGNVISETKLDSCNGITSPTPEFPNGIYHYVLLDVANSNSSIKCFSGVVQKSLLDLFKTM